MHKAEITQGPVPLEAAEVIREALARGGRPCITCSFQANGMVLLDLIRRDTPDIPVLFIDTGYHFPETYEYRDRMVERWGLNLVNVTPELTVPEQEAKFGKLYENAPDFCCEMRKVAPLLKALEDYDTWFTGLRRGDSPSRAAIGQFQQEKLPSGRELLKVNPLAYWNSKDVWAYLAVNEIEHHPLYDRGYTSIGCGPCTKPPVDPNDPRSGRWAGQKLECGIHTFGRNGGGI